MRVLSAALVAVGLLSASPAFSQSSPSNYTTGYRYDAARRLVGTISPDPDGSTGPLHYAAVRNSYDPVTGELVTVEKGELAVAKMRIAGLTKELATSARNFYAAAAKTGIKGGEVARARLELMEQVIKNWW